MSRARMWHLAWHFSCVSAMQRFGTLAPLWTVTFSVTGWQYHGHHLCKHQLLGFVLNGDRLTKKKKEVGVVVRGVRKSKCPRRLGNGIWRSSSSRSPRISALRIGQASLHLKSAAAASNACEGQRWSPSCCAAVSTVCSNMSVRESGPLWKKKKKSGQLP